MEAVLGVLGSILLFIGTVLLWILGILLGIILLILLILAIPIRVQAQGQVGPDVREGEGEITYFFRLLRVSAYFKDNAFAWRLTLAGKRLAGSEAPVEEAARSPEEEPDDGVFTEEEVVSRMETEKSQAEEKVKQTVEEILPQPEPEKPREEAPEAEEIPEWAKKGLRPIRPIGPNFWERLGAKLARVESVWMQFQAYPYKPQIWHAFRKAGGKLLHSMRLRRSHIHLRFGWQDPAYTGLTMGVASMIGQFLNSSGCHIELEPNFEEACLEASGKLEFQIRILYILWLGLGLLANRYVRELLLLVLRKAKNRAN
mgnify:FL=1